MLLVLTVGPKPVRHSLPNPSLLPNPSVFCCLRAFTFALSCPSLVNAAVHDYVVSRERINPLLVPTAPTRGTVGRASPGDHPRYCSGRTSPLRERCCGPARESRACSARRIEVERGCDLPLKE